MKFNREELHRSRLELETELKSIKPILSKPHQLPESAQLQYRKWQLRAKISFVYAALAYSRNKIHFSGMSSEEQATWLINQIAQSKKQEEWANGPYGKNHPNKGFHHFFLLGESKKEAA
jgi:hypothetical protein